MSAVACLVAVSLAITAAICYGQSMDGLDAGRFFLGGAISYDTFQTNVTLYEWLELYECPLGPGAAASTSEVKPKHTWSVDGMGLPSFSDDIVTRNSVYRDGACISATSMCSVSDSGTFPMYLYTGNFEEPDTADLFFSNDANAYMWWVRCDNASAILEMICTNGRIKLMVTDDRPTGEGVISMFTMPPFWQWSETFMAFTTMAFDGSVVAEAFNLAWKPGAECTIPP